MAWQPNLFLLANNLHSDFAANWECAKSGAGQTERAGSKACWLWKLLIGGMAFVHSILQSISFLWEKGMEIWFDWLVCWKVYKKEWTSRRKSIACQAIASPKILAFVGETKFGFECSGATWLLLRQESQGISKKSISWTNHIDIAPGHPAGKNWVQGCPLVSSIHCATGLAADWVQSKGTQQQRKMVGHFLTEWVCKIRLAPCFG